MFKSIALVTLAGVFAANRTALCEKILAAPCTGTYSAWPTVPPNVSYCVTLMMAIPDGTDNATSGNSIACRETWANRITTADAHNCRFAAPSGGGVCGIPLVSACSLLTGYCNTEFPTATACETTLAASAPFHGSLQGVAATSENSLECRLYHGMAGFIDPLAAGGAHCSNHALAASTQCTANITGETAHHCAQLQATCNTAATTQYNSVADCIQSHGAFPAGIVSPTSLNDMGCRQYHGNAAVSASPNPLQHCQHAGPTGGGVCGADVRWSWAYLANVSSCKTNVPSVGLGVVGVVNNWNATDLDAVVPRADPATYVVNGVGNTDACRIYHLTVASNNVSHCVHGDVFGGGVCGAIQTVFCTAFTRACGTTQAACETATAMVLPRMGSPTDMTGDTFACRAYWTGMALGLKKVGQPVTQSCSNAAGTTVCVGAPPAKSSASSLAATALLAFVPLLM